MNRVESEDAIFIKIMKLLREKLRNESKSKRFTATSKIFQQHELIEKKTSHDIRASYQRKWKRQLLSAYVVDIRTGQEISSCRIPAGVSELSCAGSVLANAFLDLEKEFFESLSDR